jgi:hypothetical protein
MSSQAVTATTQGLRALLAAALPGRLVTLLPPGEDPPTVGSGVNLYLYQVTASPYAKNEPFPGDRAGVPPRDRPVLALELWYLLTPFGPNPGEADEKDEAHAALGEAMLALHEAPILGAVHRPGFDADTELAAALRDSFEDVRVRLHPLSVEDLSHIWGTIGKPYRLSVAYQVSLVQLYADEPPVRPGEVTRTVLDVSPFAAPRVDALDPAAGPVATFAAGVTPATLTLRGSGLAAPGRVPAVTVAGVPAPVRAAEPGTVTVELPDALPAGPEAEVVVTLGATSPPGTLFRVEPWAGAVTPQRFDLAGPAVVVVTGAGLTGAAELVATDPGGTQPRWTAPVDAARSDATTVSVDLPAGAASNLAPAGGIPNGRYAVRVRLDGGALTPPRVLLVAPVVRPADGAAGASGYDAAQRRLTVRGERLDGEDVRLRVDGTEYALGAQADPAAVSHQFARALAAGEHLVEVVVDGHRSDAIRVTV